MPWSHALHGGFESGSTEAANLLFSGVFESCPGLIAHSADAKCAVFAVRWEHSDLQVGLTMGNVASAITYQPEETAMVAELRAGSEDAFAWLIERYHRPIYSLLARTVHDRGEAADLTQEVFVKVFR